MGQKYMYMVNSCLMALEGNQKEAKSAEEEERVQGWRRSQNAGREILEGRERLNLIINISPILGRSLKHTWIEGRGPQRTRCKSCTWKPKALSRDLGFFKLQGKTVQNLNPAQLTARWNKNHRMQGV